MGQLTTHDPQPESNHQHSRIDRRRPIDDRLTVNLRRRTVREVQLKTDAPLRQTNPALTE